MTIWYRQGTASVENGSTSVTGALTTWLNQVKPGDGITFDDGGTWSEVASVEGNTSLTLATEYAGETVSSGAYAIDRRSPQWSLASDLAVKVASLLGSITTLILTSGKPNDGIGNNGAIAFDPEAQLFYFKADSAWSEGESFKGDGGWSPAFGLVADGDRIVMQVADWVGGDGEKPATGAYVGADGLTETIGDAIDIRGAEGDPGDPGADGWSPILAAVADSDRRVFRVVDWVGGEGAKPATGKYLGPSGLVDAVGDGTDVRGPAGSGAGDVVGPGATVVAGEIAVFSDTTGEAIEGAGVTIGGIASAMRPTANSGLDFGTTALRWKDGYFDKIAVNLSTSAPTRDLDIGSSNGIAQAGGAFGAQLSGTGSGNGMFGGNLYVTGSTYKTAGTHASYGYAGISCSFGVLRFFSATSTATTADAAITPTPRMIMTDGRVVFFAAATTPATSNTYGCVWYDPTGVDPHFAIGSVTGVSYLQSWAGNALHINGQGNEVFFPGHSTTATAANAVLESGVGGVPLRRSTSSGVYKDDVRSLQIDRARAVLSMRPVTYLSKCKHDDKKRRHIGLIAEEVAAIDPSLVNYGYHPDDYDFTPALDRDGKPVKTGEGTRTLKKGATLKPDYVAYERFVAPLICVVADHETRISALEAGRNTKGT